MGETENKVKDNPRLLQRKLSDGRISLYLEYYIGRKETPLLDEYGEKVYYTSGAMRGKQKYVIKHIRKKETLNLYLLQKPRTPIERQQNKEILELAKKIRFEQEQIFKEQTLGYRLKSKNTNFIDFMYNYMESKTADKSMVKGVINRFINFLKEEYTMFSQVLTPKQINKRMIEEFAEYLLSKGKGQGGYSYYKRFKSIMKEATEKRLFKENPCKDVIFKTDEGAIRKDILSEEEIKKLIGTKYKGQNEEVRRAFIFSLYTGVRFCDVKEFTFANVDYFQKVLSFDQSKTTSRSSKSWVYVPLHDDLIKLIGKGEPNEKIFKLPVHKVCLRALSAWTKKAGINKHITWHCARHSFAVNILNNGANIVTVSSLLGHSSIMITEKYTRAVDSLKQAAINSLQKIEIEI